MSFDLGDYIDVPARIAEFKAKHPEGTLQPADLANPFRVLELGGSTFIMFQAAAYRSPDDPRPGIGTAYEPFPGKTPYTRDSELQNAETSAWGRAIVAALASESKRIASTEDVRNRQADREAPPAPKATASQASTISDGIAHLSEDGAARLTAWWKQHRFPSLKSGQLTQEQADVIIAYLPSVEDEAVAS